MITDRIENFSLYLSVHRSLEKVRDLLQVVQQQGFPEGTFCFDEYVLTCDSSLQQTDLKAFDEQITIYYTLKGTDRLTWKSSTIQEESVEIPTEHVAIFAPQEAHALCSNNDNVKRVIIKVPV